MADMQAESPDSRASVVGRKRDLHDSMQYRESADAGDSSDEERSHKRIKGTHLSSNTTGSELQLALNDSYSSTEHSPEAGAEGSLSLHHSRPSPELSSKDADKVYTAAMQTTPKTIDGLSGVDQNPVEFQNNDMPATWNQGVQSGVRTSFAGKSKRRSRQVNSISLIGERPATKPNPAIAAEDDGPMQLAQDASRGSNDQTDELVGHGKPFTTSQTQTLSVHLAQTEVLTRQDSYAYQKTPARISGSQSNLEDRSREATNVTETQVDLLQPGAGSSDDSESEAEENSNDDGAESGGLPTPSSTAGLPQNFQIIPKKILRTLTTEEKQAYKARYALQQQITKGKKRKKLSPEVLEALDPQEREEYLVAYEANQLEREAKKLKKQAEKLAQQRIDLIEATRKAAPDDIAAGLTFYPRRCRPFYQKRGVGFPLSEVLDQGKHIHVEQFSFNVFAPAFLAAHRDKRHLISRQELVAAFHLYINSFYSHVMQFEHADRLRTSTTADDALTVEQATRLADTGAPVVSNTSNGPSGKSNIGRGTTSVLLLAEAVEHPDNASVGGLGSNPPKRVDATSSPGESDRSGAESMWKNHPSLATNANTVAPFVTKERQNTAEGNDTAMVDVLPAEAKDLLGADMPLPEEVESMDFEIDEAELFLQQRYFPARTTTTTSRCLSCGHLGHRSSGCPLMVCTSCSTFGKHSTDSCPLKARCYKCRERGHLKEDCREKLARSKAEAVACDLCGSKDHLELACDHVWRSYEPKPEEIRTVRDIPVHCYICGTSDHYGPECGLHTGRTISGGSTWSRRNLEKYLDPTSPDRALSAGVDYSIPPWTHKQFSIKGKASDPIEIEDSDDGEGFIRAKINPPVQSGHIRFGRSTEQSLPRRRYEDARGSGSMQSNPGDMSYYPAQPPQHSFNRPSGPPQGMHPRSMGGPTNGGGGKKGPKPKKGGPAEPGKKKRNKNIDKKDRDRLQMEKANRDRG